MAPRDMKGYWLIFGLVCIAMGLYFVAREKEQPAPELDIVVPKSRSIEASALANSPVAKLLSRQATPFLDPDDHSIAANQDIVNRTPVNMGEHLDTNGERPPLSESSAANIGQTPSNVGENLDPDREPDEPLVANKWDSGNNRSEVGLNLNPDAKSADTLSVESLEKKNVDTFLEVDI